MSENTPQSSNRRIASFAILIAVYLIFSYVIPKPVSMKQEGWQFTGLFIAMVLGLMLEPMPGGAFVLVCVTLSTIVGGVPIAKALAGYADPTVWLVMAAFFISRALINTGLARRIALFFVRIFGRTSIGVTYALALSDFSLAGIIPSNGARSGGVILPIVRSIAELYGSSPGATANVLGRYLMMAVYQSICVTCAMFFTGQASNPIAAGMAKEQGFTMTVGGWFMAGIVPGLVSMAVIPWVVMRMSPPLIRKTPAAREFATSELNAMGGMSNHEKILAVVFVVVCTLWVTKGTWHQMDITVTALVGCGALLLMGVLKWEDVRAEKTAWDMFVWYGGLVNLGKILNETGVTTLFANGVVGMFGTQPWPILFASALLIYFYTHYGLASITAHLLAMYTPFVAVLKAQGAPIGLVCYAFACFVNLSAGLTHYGTTPSPMFFAQDYVSFKDWWRVGFVVSVVNLLIWSTIGFGWWKLIGIW